MSSDKSVMSRRMVRAFAPVALLAAAGFAAMTVLPSVYAQQNQTAPGAAPAGAHEGHAHGDDAKAGDKKVTKAVAVLHPASGSEVHGTVTFTQEEDGVKVVAHVEGLTPGLHGFHVHEFGDCTAPDATSAGGHFNPTEEPHGAPTDNERHVGDFGNIEANEQGVGHLELTDKKLKLDGPNGILGHALIVHEKNDDLKSQPTGNAGGRVACGVVGVANPAPKK